MKLGIEFSRKLSLAYESMCKPLCHELKLPQTAFDILMFLANNPEFKTARDIVNGYSEMDLYRIIRDYGEDKFAKNIAKTANATYGAH